MPLPKRKASEPHDQFIEQRQAGLQGKEALSLVSDGRLLAAARSTGAQLV